MKYTIALLAAAIAVEASPFAKPQGVTAAISPTAAAPSGCLPSYTSTFGIAVMNVSQAAGVGAQPEGQPTAGAAPVSTISDGQPQASTGVAPVTQISDGQIQASTRTVVGVSQISDGQIQATTMTMMPINQIGDGQIQNQKTTLAPISQISDGQIQATKTAAPVSQISDGQIQASRTASAVSQISDGQIQASGTAVGTMADGQPTASAGAAASTGGTSYVACKQSDSLQITLNNGVLKDNQGRTGYIASNYQFQFDGPPQAGALYTAGFSACSNGTLSLGGSSVFYQCLSGNFYNLYDRSWAPQCSPVHIEIVQLVNC